MTQVSKDDVTALIAHVADCRCTTVPAGEGTHTNVLDSRCVTSFVIAWADDGGIVKFAERVIGGPLTAWQREVLTAAFPAFPPGIEGIPHKSHYGVDDLAERCLARFNRGGDHRPCTCGQHKRVCNRDHVHDTPKEAVACDRLDLLTESRAEAAYRLGLDTENAPDSTV